MINWMMSYWWAYSSQDVFGLFIFDAPITWDVVVRRYWVLFRLFESFFLTKTGFCFDEWKCLEKTYGRVFRIVGTDLWHFHLVFIWVFGVFLEFPSFMTESGYARVILSNTGLIDSNSHLRFDIGAYHCLTEVAFVMEEWVPSAELVLACTWKIIFLLIFFHFIEDCTSRRSRDLGLILILVEWVRTVDTWSRDFRVVLLKLVYEGFLLRWIGSFYWMDRSTFTSI